MMPAFADHFSNTAASYASFRPHYPQALFAWLAQRAPARRRAWDCGTGNGQAAVALAAYFAEVIASDPSVPQLSHAEHARGVSYVAMTAERAALADHSVEIVTVAQALHWFDLASFYREVERVLSPGGAVAVWSYNKVTVAPGMDELITRFHDETVGPYWPAGRAMVNSGYAGIEFPFEEEAPPTFEMNVEWTFSQFGGYLSTWSAVSRYRAARGDDPVPAFMESLAPHWGDANASRTVRWPLVVRLGRPRR
jgi:ubiquinone/menaquinone biosynthesis C-methylase UbiE